MGLNAGLIIGQTPLDDDDIEGLLIPSVTTRTELDEFEQLNIEKAIQWTLQSRIKINEILTERFIKLVHKKMFGDIWKWAGTFRVTEKNLGVEAYRIQVDLKILLDDCTYWVGHETYSPDEIAIRFKHRLVAIHCFSNGNGRHSRLMADLIINRIFGKQVFTWNSSREDYIKAVKAADLGDINPLLKFARS